MCFWILAEDDGFGTKLLCIEKSAKWAFLCSGNDRITP